MTNKGLLEGRGVNACDNLKSLDSQIGHGHGYQNSLWICRGYHIFGSDVCQYVSCLTRCFQTVESPGLKRLPGRSSNMPDDLANDRIFTHGAKLPAVDTFVMCPHDIDLVSPPRDMANFFDHHTIQWMPEYNNVSTPD